MSIDSIFPKRGVRGRAHRPREHTSKDAPETLCINLRCARTVKQRFNCNRVVLALSNVLIKLGARVATVGLSRVAVPTV